ncbi:FHA domain-containing protein [Glaciihabitans arcticus]|uniref:FHA domain-containing protein n=1 Tax=Glaciihabitans arcticus TaxID=2668039 RepID=UPI0013875CB3|nr:FHA domain-containing protein [Glaciihabitans arcticus]
MESSEYRAGPNPTIIGANVVAMLAGPGAGSASAYISAVVASARGTEEVVAAILEAPGTKRPDFVVAQFFGPSVRAQFRGSRLGIRVVRRDGGRVVYTGQDVETWASLLETSCLTAELFDTAPDAATSASRIALPGSLSTASLTYSSEASVLPEAVALVAPEPVTRPSALPERTVVIPARNSTAVATLEFTDGNLVDVDRTVIIGRSPRAERSTSALLPTLVPVASPRQKISRTHLKVSVDGTRVVLEDLGSKNGTEVTATNGIAFRVIPGEPAELSDGMIVAIGDQVAFKVVARS